jgi:hypothetical protein
MVHIEAICIKIAVPKRIFMGSERAELASSQDAKTWTMRLKARRNRQLTPRIVIPFIDRLLALGILPQPKQWKISWEDAETLTQAEKASIAQQLSAAMAQYVSGNVEAIMPVKDYLTKVIGLDDDEAQACVDASNEQYQSEDGYQTPGLEQQYEGDPQGYKQGMQDGQAKLAGSAAGTAGASATAGASGSERG